MLIREARQQEEAKRHRKNHYTLKGGIWYLTTNQHLPTATPHNTVEGSISHCELWQLD